MQTFDVFTIQRAEKELVAVGLCLKGPFSTNRWLWHVEEPKSGDIVKFENDNQLMYFVLGILWAKELVGGDA